MTTIVVPNFGCNLECAYCFATPVRDKEYKPDLEAMKNQIAKIDPHDDVVIHGGECTAIPLKDLEFLLDACYKVKGRTSIMTNGYFLSPHLIRLFKKYKTDVGLSIDGPPEFNRLRGFPTDPAANQEYNERLLSNINWMRNERIEFGHISVLHKANAGDEHKVRELIKWLTDFNMPSGRLNLMTATRPEAKKYELSPQEASRAYKQIYLHLRERPELKWLPFREFTDNLLGKRLAPCHTIRCDFFSTVCKSVMPDGAMGNCDMTFMLDAYSRTETSNERYAALKETDCAGCEYWEVCGGGCPGTGEEGDWRNRTIWCETYKTLYSLIEHDLRGLFPNIDLSIDIPNFFEEYHLKGKTPVPLRSIEQSTWSSLPPREKEAAPVEKDECPHKFLPGHVHIPHSNVG